MAAESERRDPVLEGVIGWVRGEVFPLKQETNIIGRSRHCDISLRQCKGYLRQPATERDLDHDFNTVSRRHATITVKGHVVTIEDLSTNGTFCNEVLLTERKSYDLAVESPLLRLGTRESFRLSLWPNSLDGKELATTAANGGQPANGAETDPPVSTEHMAIPPSERGDTAVADLEPPSRSLKNQRG
jgi:pSer/pThr/pTyr-binding forkhead associated (FHA) protein